MFIMLCLGDEANFHPFAWWVSRTGQRMDYWAGATPGSRMCQCGVLGSCLDQTKWCNCDAEYTQLKPDGEFHLEVLYVFVNILKYRDHFSSMFYF